MKKIILKFFLSFFMFSLGFSICIAQVKASEKTQSQNEEKKEGAKEQAVTKKSQKSLLVSNDVFSFEFPKGWTVIDDQKSAILRGKGSSFYPTIMLDTTQLKISEETNIDMDSFVKGIQKLWTKDDPSKLLKEGSLTVGNRVVRFLIVSVTDREVPALVVKLYILNHKNKIVMIYASSARDDFKRLEPIFDESVKTFSFK